jgi:hypothetical protein
MAKSFRKPAVTEQELEKRDRANALCQSIAFKGPMRRKDIAYHIGVDSASLSIWTRGLAVVPDYVIDRLVELERKVSEAYVEDASTPMERIKKYIAYRGMSVSAFERAAGLSAGYVYSLGVTMRESTFGKLGKVFPDLNIEWLKTGEGDMLNGYAVVVAADRDAKLKVAELEAEVRTLKEEVERLRKQNAKLVDRLLEEEQ